MKDTFNFSHDYYKFHNMDDPMFTTIRGATSYREYEIGQIVTIKVKRKIIGSAMIVTKVQKKIKEVSIEFLKADAEYPGRSINSHQDFIDLLNEFRRFGFVSSDLQIITIFTLHWDKRN